MEVFAPSTGLIVMELLFFVNLACCVMTIVWLAAYKTLSPYKKLAWLLAILFLPLMGALTCFAVVKRTLQAKKSNSPSA